LGNLEFQFIFFTSCQRPCVSSSSPPRPSPLYFLTLRVRSSFFAFFSSPTGQRPILLGTWLATGTSSFRLHRTTWSLLSSRDPTFPLPHAYDLDVSIPPLSVLATLSFNFNSGDVFLYTSITGRVTLAREEDVRTSPLFFPSMRLHAKNLFFFHFSPICLCTEMATTRT